MPGEKSIVLNGENSTNAIFIEVAMGGYINVFTNPEIAISKKFKKCLLNRFSFTDHLCLLVVDKIYLVEE